jgi:hypothetical protein
LEVVAGKAAGTSILVVDELVIGRHADGAGRLADDEEISRTHARVTLEPNGVCEIEDLGSTNGTYLNGLRISAPEELSVGDTIELGQTTLAVRELPAPPRPGANKLFFPEEEFEEDEFEDEDFEEEAPGAPPPAPVAAGPGPGDGPEAPDFDRDVYEPPAMPAGEPPAAFEPPTEVEPQAPIPAPVPGPAPISGPPAVPAPSAEAGPEADASPAPEALAAAPRLNLQLEIDFANREARVSLDHGSEPVRFVFEAGEWRVAPSPPREEGDAP